MKRVPPFVQIVVAKDYGAASLVALDFNGEVWEYEAGLGWSKLITTVHKEHKMMKTRQVKPKVRTPGKPGKPGDKLKKAATNRRIGKSEIR